MNNTPTPTPAPRRCVIATHGDDGLRSGAHGMPIGRANGIKYDVPTAAERGRMSVYIETLRRRLVDLTGRNRLISFRPQKRSSLELLHPDIPAIWRRLMEEEKTWHLIPGIREEDDDEQNKEAVISLSSTRTTARASPSEATRGSCERKELPGFCELGSMGTNNSVHLGGMRFARYALVWRR